MNVDGTKVSSYKRIASLIPDTPCREEKTGTGTVDASVADKSTVRNSNVPTTKENVEGTKMCVDVFVSDNTEGTDASSDEKMASLMPHDSRHEEKAEGAKISVPVSEKITARNPNILTVAKKNNEGMEISCDGRTTAGNPDVPTTKVIMNDSHQISAQKPKTTIVVVDDLHMSGT